MCGIAGCIVAPGRETDRAALERMADALAHRGPDDRGVEVVGPVGLVATRLSIVDVSPAGHQPMGSADGAWWIAYNGEVFNHLELRERLGPREWHGGSDTETVLAALEAWGDDALPRFNGLFGFAALDRARKRVLLARDRFGVKPLYLARHDGAVWFASEIRALLATGVSARPRPDVLAHAVGYGWAEGPQTPLAGSEGVAPGSLVEVELGSLETAERSWYEPPVAVDAERAAALAEQPRGDLARELEEELRAAVRRRLMADVPVGTMCSGGLDSSLIAAFARDDHPDIRAYNAAVADQPEIDEGPWAERVAEALGIELRTVVLTAEAWRAGLVETALHNEHPLVHESSVPMAMIAGLAHDDGVKVLLSGEGADELFGGYDWVHGLQAREWAARGPLRLARAARRRSRHVEQPPYERAVHERALAAYAHHRGARRRYEAALLASLRTYLPHLLNRQDKNTMQRSIETRVPFLDPAVARFALNLPLELRVEPERKALLRDVAAGVLPREVAERPKVGFGFDMGRYLAAARPEFLGDGALREVLGVARADWGTRVGELRGQPLLLATTAEILLRGLTGGESPAAIDRALWG